MRNEIGPKTLVQVTKILEAHLAWNEDLAEGTGQAWPSVDVKLELSCGHVIDNCATHGPGEEPDVFRPGDEVVCYTFNGSPAHTSNRTIMAEVKGNVPESISADGSIAIN